MKAPSMKSLKPLLSRALILALALWGASASALDILLTNDDGYQHPNIRALYRELKAAGHRVAISAPYGDQSARGGAFFYGVEVISGRDEDPGYPDSHYLKTRQSGLCLSEACAGKEVDIEISATPVMAALYGIERVLPKADLVISGPNVGHNLGWMNNHSGTFNAAALALRRGYPVLAVSADMKEKDLDGVAHRVRLLVERLDRARAPGAKLLPPGVGLNVNIPPTGSIRGYRLTGIGSWLPYDLVHTDDLGGLWPEQAGKAGVSFRPSPAAGPDQAKSEAVGVEQGFVTLSPFNGLPGVPEPSRDGALERWLAHLIDSLPAQ